MHFPFSSASSLCWVPKNHFSICSVPSSTLEQLWVTARTSVLALAVNVAPPDVLQVWGVPPVTAGPWARDTFLGCAWVWAVSTGSSRTCAVSCSVLRWQLFGNIYNKLKPHIHQLCQRDLVALGIFIEAGISPSSLWELLSLSPLFSSPFSFKHCSAFQLSNTLLKRAEPSSSKNTWTQRNQHSALLWEKKKPVSLPITMWMCHPGHIILLQISAIWSEN